MKITEKTKLSKILGDAKMEKILGKFDFPCLSCPCARYEMERLDVGSVCEMYDIDCAKLLKELNKDQPKKK